MLCLSDFKPREHSDGNIVILSTVNKTAALPNVTSGAKEVLSTTTDMPIVDDEPDELTYLIINCVTCVISLPLSSLMVVGILKVILIFSVFFLEYCIIYF